MLRKCTFSKVVVLVLLTMCFKAAHAFLPHQGGKQVLRFQKVWSGSQHSTITMRAGTAGFNRSVGRVVALDLSALSIDSLAIGACERIVLLFEHRSTSKHPFSSTALHPRHQERAAVQWPHSRLQHQHACSTNRGLQSDISSALSC
jgi:hypothetical protein